ncbi:MAG: exodeoxyribonuclease V beta subunit, partial [Cocleimonas sp.]
MLTLKPETIPLESINLIEASAGTGKSWTVTYLYLRLLLEKNLTVDQILVVTFTDAATKELRDDIRQRIVAALSAFESADSEQGYDKKDEYNQLIDNCSDKVEAIRKLNRAKLSMDEAAVFTIHGFCQRSLSENAFEAALPFESELLENQTELMQKLTDDFWRKYTGQGTGTGNEKPPKSLLFKLHQKSITPDSLLNDIKNAVGKPYLKICGPESDEIKAEKWQSLEDQYHLAIELWRSDHELISQLLTNPDYEKHYYKALLDNTDSILNEIRTLAQFDKLPYRLDTKIMKWLGTEAKLKKTAKVDPIDHPFFQAWQDFLDLWAELDVSSDDFLNITRIKLIKYLQEELPKEKQRLGVLSFDDLLLQMQQAVTDENGNPSKLAGDLRKKYQAGLIDEFQDTDPIQYDIFHKIYNNSAINSITTSSTSVSPANASSASTSSTNTSNAVFYVGDPKQAIYSFRGGDIHTYLKAKADTQTQNTLVKNWRSHPDLINAFNKLYAIADNPFKDEGIAYVQVEAGDKNTDEVVMTQIRSSLNFWQYEFEDDAEGKSKISVGTIRQDIANSIAGDIAQTLNDGLQGKAKIGDKAISGGDIAILIRSHNQANTIKSALNARGIPSVQNSRDSIYETHEAKELIYLLKAILTPQQEDEVRRALVTEFMGYKGDDLIAFQIDSNAWEDILLSMQNWHQQWKKNGFLPMMRSLMKAENTHRRILSFPDGERRISNILQLSELIHQSARNNMLGMSETLRWLQKQQLNSSSNETELRLESDEDLVKIVTIHKSKGLEYPIVYCPYIGMSRGGHSEKVFTFHKEGEACLEIGSTELDEHKQLKKAEESAEDTRLLYVALTRAKYQCNLVCFTQAISGQPDRSALGWLLSNGLTIPSGASKAAVLEKVEFFETYQQNLQ